ncbi:MAG TPA: hypothetical protein VKB19_13345, partial [Pedobacter sp.]|nr:hypothetical protein [Pedobacter sp.]
MKLRRINIWLLALGLLAGCSKNKDKDHEPEVEPAYKESFVQATVSGRYTSTQLKTIAALSGYAD